MQLDSLSSLLLQPATDRLSQELRSMLNSQDGTLFSKDFLHQLQAQINALQGQEQAEPEVEPLELDPLVTLEMPPIDGINLPDGNNLPQEMDLTDMTGLAQNELDQEHQAALSVPLVAENSIPVRVNPKSGPTAETEAKQTTLVAPTEHTTTKLAAELLPEEQITETKRSTYAGQEIQKPDIALAEKTSLDNPMTAKGEIASGSATDRMQPVLEKASTMQLERPVTHPEWRQELGDRIVWMTRNSLASAELQMNPPRMGPVEVRIQLNQDQTNILFASQNAAVREAIETAVPRLREMLGTQQLNLMNVDVSTSFAEHREHQAGDGNGNQPQQGGSAKTFYPLQEGITEELTTSIEEYRQGLLNYYV